MVDAPNATAVACDAAIPVRLTLAASDLVSDQPPPPVMVMVRRFGYLAFAVEEARPYFQHLLPPGEETPWLECQGRAVQWHIPAGVLYDLLCTDSQRPWSLTVHYRACPADVVLPWTIAVWRSTFINSLKEAAVILAGGAGRVLQMTSATQSQLWDGAQGGDMRAVAAVATQLGLPPTGGVTRLPVRVSLLGPDGGIQTTSLPVGVSGAEGAPTLRRLLDQLLDCPSPGGGDGEAGGDPPPRWQAKVGGVVVPPELSVAWLWAALHAADHFLYIAVAL
mmetsp:Transcript_19458/g.58800  ORF Transcript_19458/g.58800 Transcript_19458/m.58800 type:complete len:278 (-) Transcript_19458:227-1060(-)